MSLEDIIESVKAEEVAKADEQVKQMEKEEVHLLGPMNMLLV